MEFERFERRFKECISSSAIRTKFEHHHKQGTAIVGEMEQLLQQGEEHIIENRLGVGSQALLGQLYQERYVYLSIHNHIDSFPRALMVPALSLSLASPCTNSSS